MAVNVTNITITGIYVSFSGGQIVTVNVTYTFPGPAGETSSGQHVWQLTPAESGSAGAANFVAALTAKLAAVTGLAVVTT